MDYRRNNLLVIVRINLRAEVRVSTFHDKTAQKHQGSRAFHFSSLHLLLLYKPFFPRHESLFLAICKANLLVKFSGYTFYTVISQNVNSQHQLAYLNLSLFCETVLLSGLCFLYGCLLAIKLVSKKEAGAHHIIMPTITHEIH